MRSPREFSVSIGDISLMGYHWQALPELDKAKRPLLLIHATGFHSRCWNQVIEHLPQFDVYAVDTTGHGQSDNRLPPFTWQQFADDLERFLVTLAIDNFLAVGHSMGGHLLPLIGAKQRIFSGMLLIDPVIFPPEMETARKAMNITEHPTQKRRNQWDSPDEMFERFSQKEPFSDWDPLVLRDYCDYGLVKVEDHYELACPPHIEAGIYMSSEGGVVYDAIKQIDIPVNILRARQRTQNDNPFDFRPSPTNPNLVNFFANACDEQLLQTHFVPMESPGLVAERVTTFNQHLDSQI